VRVEKGPGCKRNDMIFGAYIGVYWRAMLVWKPALRLLFRPAGWTRAAFIQFIVKYYFSKIGTVRVFIIRNSSKKMLSLYPSMSNVFSRVPQIEQYYSHQNLRLSKRYHKMITRTLYLLHFTLAFANTSTIMVVTSMNGTVL
jgi:hypothetical protein